MTTRDDSPNGAPAPADAGAQASTVQQSEVDLSDLDAQQEAEAQAAAAGEGDEDESEAESTDQGDAGDDDTTSEEDGDETDDDGDSDDDAEDGDEDESDEDGERPRKRNRSERYRDRIAKLEAENQRLRGRTDAGRLTDAQIDERVKKIIGEPPKESDFPNDYLAFDREAAAYAADKRAVTRQVKAEAERESAAEQTRNVERVERHNDRVEEFRNRGRTPEERKANAKDWDAAIASAANLKVAPHVEDLLLDSKKSAHLQLYLAKNPGKLAELNHMTERDAARAMGAIETRLSVPKPKTRTSAPPPPKRQIRGGAQPASQDSELNSYLDKQYGPNRR